GSSAFSKMITPFGISLQSTVAMRYANRGRSRCCIRDPVKHDCSPHRHQKKTQKIRGDFSYRLVIYCLIRGVFDLIRREFSSRNIKFTAELCDILPISSESTEDKSIAQSNRQNHAIISYPKGCARRLISVRCPRF